MKLCNEMFRNVSVHVLPPSDGQTCCIVTHPLNTMNHHSLETKGELMLFDGDTRKRFGEDVGNHLTSRKEVGLNLTALDGVANPVPLDINVLHATMVLRVLEDLESRLVVNHQVCRSLDIDTDLAQE